MAFTIGNPLIFSKLRFKSFVSYEGLHTKKLVDRPGTHQLDRTCMHHTTILIIPCSRSDGTRIDEMVNEAVDHNTDYGNLEED